MTITSPSNPTPATALRHEARGGNRFGAEERRRFVRRGATAPQASMGILVVEDDDDSRDILSTYLASQGFPVMSARNGRDALERLRHAAAPCLILLDLRMPMMDGWALRRAMLADPMLASIPVIVISAVHDVEQAVAGLNVTSYLEKPYDFPAILRLVKRYC